MTEEHKKDYYAGDVAVLKTKYDDQCNFMETLKAIILNEKVSGLDAVRGASVVEVPVEMQKRQNGESSIGHLLFMYFVKATIRLILECLSA